MSPLPSPEPLLFKAWHALSTQLGQDNAQRFFESYVVNGREILVALGYLPAGDAETAEPVGVAAATVATPAVAVATPPTTPLPISPTMRPTTRVNRQRHNTILERTWLVTGFILRVAVAGRPPRRIPLNYSTLLVSQEGSHTDIELPLIETGAFQLKFTWTGAAFAVAYESGTLPVIVNEHPLEAPCTLADGDTIKVGRAVMRVFKLLEPPAELVVVSGQGAGERYIIDTSEMRLGRFGKRDNDINLQDPTVSREHASIWFHDKKFWLVPESNTSPTVVNGEPVTQPRALVDNDQVLLGEQTMQFRVRGAAARPKTLHSRVATILFSDLRGWTPLAESLPLQDLIAQMDEYFKAMGEIISVRGGTLLTYQGDAIMAIFGAPSSHADDPWRAVSSAVQMQQQLRLLNIRWQAAGRPPLTCGIGVHTGLCMVGEMGHQSRLEYTAMGDTANLAARLEQLTRDLECDIILSDATYKEVADQVEVRDLGDVTVKGRSVPTRAFDLRGLREAQKS